jgi:hypothetical protein
VVLLEQPDQQELVAHKDLLVKPEKVLQALLGHRAKLGQLDHKESKEKLGQLAMSDRQDLRERKDRQGYQEQ